MAESVIERGIEGLRRQPQFRGAGSVIRHELRKSAILLIGVYVLEAGQLLHFGQQEWSPCLQILNVIGLDGVLIKRIAAPAPDTQILGRL